MKAVLLSNGVIPSIIGEAVMLAIFLVMLHRDKKARAKALHAQRKAEYAAEVAAVGERIKREMLLNEITKECDNKKAPLRKACGVFSDDAAQELLK